MFCGFFLSSSLSSPLTIFCYYILLLFSFVAVQLENVQVVQVKPAELNQGALTIQVGAGEAKPKRVRKPQKGHFSRANVEPKIQLVEFKVSPEAVLEPGRCQIGDVYLFACGIITPLC